MALKAEKPITRGELRRSKGACYRIEDELLRRIRPLHVESKDLHEAIERVIHGPPDWCEPRAFYAIGRRMQNWVTTFGDLKLWWKLRQQKDE